jgi:hypothetical protein
MLLLLSRNKAQRINLISKSEQIDGSCLYETAPPGSPMEFSVNESKAKLYDQGEISIFYE